MTTETETDLRARLAAVEAERDEARAEAERQRQAFLGECQRHRATSARMLDNLQAERARADRKDAARVAAERRAEALATALDEYGRHDVRCAAVRDEEAACTCGLDAALSAPAPAESTRGEGRPSRTDPRPWNPLEYAGVVDLSAPAPATELQAPPACATCPVREALDEALCAFYRDDEAECGHEDISDAQASVGAIRRWRAALSAPAPAPEREAAPATTHEDDPASWADQRYRMFPERTER